MRMKIPNAISQTPKQMILKSASVIVPWRESLEGPLVGNSAKSGDFDKCGSEVVSIPRHCDGLSKILGDIRDPIVSSILGIELIAPLVLLILAFRPHRLDELVHARWLSDRVQ